MIHRNESNNLHRDGQPAVQMGGLAQWFFDGKLHRTDGPAVETSAGTRLHYWRGVHIPHDLWVKSGSMGLGDVLGIENLELRRSILEKIGLARVESDAQLIDANDARGSRLLRLHMPDDEDLVFVSVLDGTPKGTVRQRYHVRVPPNQQYVDQAVAWTFDMTAKEYVCEVET